MTSNKGETQKDLKKYVNLLIQALNDNEFTYEIHHFDSGAIIVDVRIDRDLYSIQMTENKFGWSKIDGETGFCSIPESEYLEWNVFKREIDLIIESRI